MHYTVADWAQWARQKEVAGAQEVLDYLNAKWPQVHTREQGAKRSAEEAVLSEGLSTPLSEGVGSRMMERMGWVRGEVLGAEVDGVAGTVLTSVICFLVYRYFIFKQRH